MIEYMRPRVGPFAGHHALAPGGRYARGIGSRRNTKRPLYEATVTELEFEIRLAFFCETNRFEHFNARQPGRHEEPAPLIGAGNVFGNSKAGIVDGHTTDAQYFRSQQISLRGVGARD